jgi:hypothetical protein
MSDPASLTTRQLAALLDASRKAIAAEIAALGQHARDRLIDGQWCANEIVGHLIEAEQRGFAGRIRIILGADHPRLEAWVPTAVAAVRRDALRDPDDLLDAFIGIRDESLVLVRSLGPSALAKVGLHPQVGEISVADIAHEWVHHDREHLASILDLTRRLVWPAMGNARRFKDPDA